MITVNVAQKRIDDGDRNACCSCPIALAMTPDWGKERKWPEVTNPSIHLKDGHCTIQEDAESPREIHKFTLPEAAQKFVLDWQDKKQVNPLSFTVDPVLVRVSFGRGTLG